MKISRKEKKKRIADLNKRIELCEYYKEQLTKKAMFEKHDELVSSLDGKSLAEWIDEYNDYIRQCKNHLKIYASLEEKNMMAPLLIGFIFLLIAGTLFIQPRFIGLFVAEDRAEFSDPFGINFTEDTNISWLPEQVGYFDSIRLTGSYVGSGKFRIYLITSDNQLLLADESTLEDNALQAIVPFVENESIESLIEHSVSYKQDSLFDTDNDGRENLTGIVDFSVKIIKGLDESKLCTLWSVESIDNNTVSQVCYGTEECCSVYGISPLLDEWNSSFNLFYGRYGATGKNKVKAKVSYYDFGVNDDGPYQTLYASAWEGLGAAFYQEQGYFEYACIDTCSVGLDETEYEMHIESEGSILNIDRIDYSVIDPNQRPVFIQEIRDVDFSNKFKLDLLDHFEDDDKLEYSISCNVDAEFSEDSMILDNVEDDQLGCIITASDGITEVDSNAFDIILDDGNRKPELIEDFHDIKFYENMSMNLSGFFKDPDEDVLGFSLSGECNDLGYVEGDKLFLTYHKGLSFEERSCRIYASDGKEALVSNKFKIKIKNATIEKNKKPELIHKIPTIKITGQGHINLLDYFNDSDGDNLSFSVIDEKCDISVSIRDNIAIFMPSETKTYKCRFEASDGIKSKKSNKFKIRAYIIPKNKTEPVVYEALAETNVTRVVVRLISENVTALSNGSIQKTGVFESFMINTTDLEKLIADDNVLEIVIDQPVSLFLQDSLGIVRADEVLDLGISGAGQKVCIVDTGVDYTHPNITNFAYGYDFVNNDNDPMDDHGHGTAVSGVVSKIAPGAEIIVAKVIDSTGGGYESDIIAGIQYCIDQNVSVISISLGSEHNAEGFCDNNMMAQKANDAVDAGIPVVAATGNDGTSFIKVPACASDAIRVAASTKKDKVWAQSTFSRTLDVFAPGTNITSPSLGGGFNRYYGTSLAAPHVSGIIALLLENESLTPDKVKYRLRSTGKIFTVGVGNEIINFSRVDIYNAIFNNITMMPLNYTEQVVNASNITGNLSWGVNGNCDAYGCFILTNSTGDCKVVVNGKGIVFFRKNTFENNTLFVPYGNNDFEITNNLGEIKVWISEEGDAFLDGFMYTSTPPFYPLGNNDFIIENNAREVVSFVDSGTGNWYMKDYVTNDGSLDGCTA